ncbi:MFS transporter [Acetobacteraceae bacterium KSS8]|uniref:MFS transporter n=1 Tax=Endosaccharibacter trunci TaxID=2812733 RepID=A0ABT1W633_9PROT|nr:MFS transporter [Acetobacteraceae bacterium KSS8]
MPAQPSQERSFLGHPRGVSVLFTTECFGSFGQYGVQSILVLAMSMSILRNGGAQHVLGLPMIERWLGLGASATPQAGAALITGLFGGLIYAAPIVGGVVADRVLGHRPSIIIGLFGVFCGMLLLTMRPLLLIGLLLIVAGGGLAGTTKAQLGELYTTGDPRRSNGFQLYSLAPSIAVVFAPIVCGTLGEDHSWSLGFLAASAGALLAFLTYVIFNRAIRPASDADVQASDAKPAGRLADLSRRDWLMVLGLVLLLPVLALASVGNMEIFDGYLLWAKQHYDLRWFGHQMPVSWLLSADAFISMGATALSIAVWTYLERRGRPVPDMLKITIGTVLCALATLLLTAAPTGRVGLGWGLAFHIINDIGNTNTYMVSMALYSRLAPAPLRATITNACALQIFLANMVVAQLASRLGTLGPTRFWMLHTVLIAFSALVLTVVIIAGRVLRARRSVEALAV